VEKRPSFCVTLVASIWHIYGLWSIGTYSTSGTCELMTRRLSRSSFAASVQSVNKYGYSVIVVYIYTSHWVGRTFLLGARYHTVYPVLSDSEYPYMKHSCTTPLEGCEVLKGSWPRGQGSPSCSLLLLWSCGFVSALHHCADLRFAICPLLAIPPWKLSLSPCHPYRVCLSVLAPFPTTLSFGLP
jgi:hypothetical protein